MFEPCPCGGKTYLACCAPRHNGSRPAETAEALMRSRFSAFAKGDAAYLAATWAPECRPNSLQLDPRQRWIGLKVHGSGDRGAAEAWVRFTARYEVDGVAGAVRETSLFRRDRDRWTYVRALDDPPSSAG